MYYKQRTSSRVRKVFNMVCALFEWTILAFLFTSCIFLLVSSTSLGKYIQSYIIPTGSMTPTISVGSLVIVDPKVTSVGWGDIIAYTNPKNKKMTIVHRIVGQKSENGMTFIETKGDHNNDSDPWLVPPALVKGKVIFTIPYEGYVLSYTKQPEGFYITIGIPAVLLIFLEFKKIAEGIEKEVEKRTTERMNQYFYIPKFLVILLLLSSFLFLSVSSYAKAKSSLFSTVNLDGMMIQTIVQKKPTLTMEISGSHAVIFNLRNIGEFHKASYTLTYSSNDVEQEVQGDSVLEGDTYNSSPILLGTCSGNVCTYDRSVHNLHLTVTLHGSSSVVTKQTTL